MGPYYLGACLLLKSMVKAYTFVLNGVTNSMYLANLTAPELAEGLLAAALWGGVWGWASCLFRMGVNPQ